jgi:hypothetical protein
MWLPDWINFPTFFRAIYMNLTSNNWIITFSTSGEQNHNLTRVPAVTEVASFYDVQTLYKWHILYSQRLTEILSGIASSYVRTDEETNMAKRWSVCSVWYSQQTATVSPNSSNRLGMYLCVPYGSHDKQRLFPETELTGWSP